MSESGVTGKSPNFRGWFFSGTRNTIERASSISNLSEGSKINEGSTKYFLGLSIKFTSPLELVRSAFHNLNRRLSFPSSRSSESSKTEGFLNNGDNGERPAFDALNENGKIDRNLSTSSDQSVSSLSDLHVVDLSGSSTGEGDISSKLVSNDATQPHNSSDSFLGPDGSHKIEHVITESHLSTTEHVLPYNGPVISLFRSSSSSSLKSATSSIPDLLEGDPHQIEELLFSSLDDITSDTEINTVVKNIPDLREKLKDLLENEPARLAGILLHFYENANIQNKLISYIAIDTPKQAGNAAIVAVKLLKEYEAQSKLTTGAPLDSVEKTNNLASSIRKLLDQGGTNPKYMAEAIHGLSQKGELNFGVIGILMGELHFPISMKIADGEKVETPYLILSKTPLGSETKDTIDSDDVEAVGETAQGAILGILLEDAIDCEDPEYRLMINTYSNLINDEIKLYNGQDDEDGRINPNSPTFTNELSKITPQLLEKLNNAATPAERRDILNGQGWRLQRTKPGLLTKGQRLGNWDELTIGDFMFRHLRNAMRSATRIT
ncbi:MAG: hypothetical protein ACOYK6_01900 [Chthoniobacterales bacterium]